MSNIVPDIITLHVKDFEEARLLDWTGDFDPAAEFKEDPDELATFVRLTRERHAAPAMLEALEQCVRTLYGISGALLSGENVDSMSLVESVEKARSVIRLAKAEAEE